MVEQSGFEPQAPIRLSIAKLPANLAAYSALIKSIRAGEIIIATSSPHSFSFHPHRLI
jgi:hypothetical protein